MAIQPRVVSTPTPRQPTRPAAGGLDAAAKQAAIEQIYKSEFGRAPDAEGAKYWQDSQFNDPASLRTAILRGADSKDRLYSQSQQATSAPSFGNLSISDKFGAMADEYLSLSKNQFKVAQEAMNELNAQTKGIVDQQLAIGGRTLEEQELLSKYSKQMADKIAKTGDYFTEVGQRSQERYESDFVPIEQQIAGFARDYDTPERRAEAAAKARADVQTAAADQRQITARRQAALGVNPNSGRYAGVERAGDLGTAIASVGAQNQARENVENRGIALRSDAANLGRGLANMSLNQAGFGLQANQAATGIRQADQNLRNASSALALNAGSSAAGILQGNQALQNSLYGIQNQGYQGAADLLGAQVQSNVAKTQLEQNQQRIDNAKAAGEQERADANTAGIWNAIGTGVGWLLSDEDKKENKKPIEDGKALDAVNNMRVEEWKYKEGEGDGGEHIGTYAQDFNEQVGSGSDEAIPVVDAIGVTMKAVQDLSKKVDDLAVGISREGRKISSSTRDKKLKKLEQQQQLDHQQAIGTIAA